MNVHDFLTDAICKEQVRPDIPTEEAQSLVLRICNYPRIDSGVVLFSAAPEQVEWVHTILKSNMEQWGEALIGDFIRIVDNSELSDQSKEKMKNSIHAHFGTWPA